MNQLCRSFFHLTLTCAAMLVVAAPAGAAGCTPSKTTYCGAGDLTPSQAMRRVATVSGRAATRHHTVLPTARELFGRRGRWAFATANRALLSSPASAVRAHAAAAGPAMSQVGSKGGVRVDAGAEHDVGAALESSSEQVRYRDRIRGPHATQWRSLTFSATADSCPDPGNLVSTAGDDNGRILAVERILTVERRGRYQLTTELSIDLTNQNMHAWVDRWAQYVGILPGPGRMDVRLQKLRSVKDLRTGRTYREKPLTLRYEVMNIDDLWMYGADTFEDFLKKYADDNDDDPADDFRSDRLLNHQAFEAFAHAFLEAVRVRAVVLYKRAEKVWRTPNRCVELQGAVPDRMLPGQSVKVHVHAVSRRGDPVAALANQIHHFYPQKSAGLGVDPFAYVTPDPDAGHYFTLTAPAKAWSDAKPERFVVTFYSKAGIGEIDQLIRPDRYPLRYRVQDAHGTLHAHRDITEGSCTRNYEVDWTMTSRAGTGTAPDGTLNLLSNGWVTGTILAPVKLVVSGAHAWNSGDCITPQDCHFPDMTFDEYMGFSPGFQDGSATANLGWGRLMPTIGTVNGDDCHLGMSTAEEAQLIPNPYVQQVPTTQITRPSVAVTFARTLQYDKDYPGSHHSGKITWNLSLTAQRIDEHGKPIGG